MGKANQLDSVLNGIQSAIDAGFTSVKINTVLSRHWTDDEVHDLLTYVETWPVIWRFYRVYAISRRCVSWADF